jgi:hypothetical protein
MQGRALLGVPVTALSAADLNSVIHNGTPIGVDCHQKHRVSLN